MRKNVFGTSGRHRGVAFLCSVLAIFVIGCAATGNVSEAVASEGEIEIVPANLTGFSARAVPTGRYIFEDSEEWEEFWSKRSDAPPPEFDFDEFTLVAVFLGQKPNPGYSVRIVRATVQKSETIVEIVEYLPSPGMMSAQVIVYPFDAALIPKTGKAIRFAVSKKSGRP